MKRDIRKTPGTIKMNLKSVKRGLRAAAGAAVCAAVLFAPAAEARAALPTTDVSYMPAVTDEMTSPDYWVREDAAADTVLADIWSIGRLNAATVQTKDCNMYDLYEVPQPVSAGLPDRLYESAQSEMKGYTNGKYFDRDGNPFSEEKKNAIAENCLSTAWSGEHGVLYGIAVNRTDLRAWPTEEIVTDERGDINFDYAQLSSVRVNEPMILRSMSADGRYYYGHTNNCSGWVLAEDIAVCSNRAEWLGAWDIAEDRKLVVADNRIYLEESNTDPEVSGLMLTQGTILELAVGPGTSGLITNRSPQYNHVVYVPVRLADGSYQKKPALISKHYDVSIGSLPLTRRSILRVAFNMLGDAYGWGGMLGAEDCSGYIRGIYRCFGLELPRNTTWQSKAPAQKYDLTGMSAEEKSAVISQLPAGTTLFFSGHEMMYLGTENGQHYVISSVSSASDPFGPGLSRMRVRSVVINTLDIRRMNGKTWLESLNAAMVPYQF